MQPVSTVPYVKISLIRFLGNQSLGTTLAHNFATLQTEVLDAVDYLGFRERVLGPDRDLKLLPVNLAFATSPT